MKANDALTTEEVAKALKVSKLTVYDLIKRGTLPSYRVGRQIRVERSALDQYKRRGQKDADTLSQQVTGPSIIIQGQDHCLDILGKYLEQKQQGLQALRSNIGSLDGLVAMYQGKIDIASTHLFDGDTATYNLPYIRKLLVSKSFIVIHLFKRKAGLYVANGNPKNICSWQDFAHKSLTMINREAGAGARVLLDEQLRLLQIDKRKITGYNQIVTTHLDIASAVATGKADVGVGTLQAAKMANIDFIPLIDESYDLVLLQTSENNHFIQMVLDIVNDINFRESLESLGHQTTNTGKVLYKQ